MAPFSRARSLGRFLILAITLGLISASIHAAEVATHPFEHDILAFEAGDRVHPPPAGEILFVGDSQFTRWKTIQQDLPEYRVINRGFGGSRMSDLLYYTDRIVLPYQPRLIVVNEGGNDIHTGRTPEQILADVKTFVDHVRAVLPEVPIVFNGMTPSPARWSESDIKRRYNEMLKAYVATGKKLAYVELFNAYLGPDGRPRPELFAPDQLHHSPAGYAVRIHFLRPYLGAPHVPAKS